MRAYFRTVLSLFVFLLLMAWSAAAYAADGGDGDVSAVAELAIMFMQIVVFPALSGLVAYLLALGAAYVKKRWKIDLMTRREDKIDSWIEGGIHWAEERSRQFVKEKAGRIAGHEKKQQVAAWVLELVKQNGWDEWTRTAIEDRIDAAIGKHRANGGKPTLDKEVAPPPLPEAA
jgi:hypothetical protein